MNENFVCTACREKAKRTVADSRRTSKGKAPNATAAPQVTVKLGGQRVASAKAAKLPPAPSVKVIKPRPPPSQTALSRSTTASSYGSAVSASNGAAGWEIMPSTTPLPPRPRPSQQIPTQPSGHPQSAPRSTSVSNGVASTSSTSSQSTPAQAHAARAPTSLPPMTAPPFNPRTGLPMPYMQGSRIIYPGQQPYGYPPATNGFGSPYSAYGSPAMPSQAGGASQRPSNGGPPTTGAPAPSYFLGQAQLGYTSPAAHSATTPSTTMQQQQHPPAPKPHAVLPPLQPSRGSLPPQHPGYSWPYPQYNAYPQFAPTYGAPMPQPPSSQSLPQASPPLQPQPSSTPSGS